MTTDTIEVLLALHATIQQTIDDAEKEQQRLVQRMAALCSVKKGDTITDPSEHGGGPFRIDHLSYSPANSYHLKPTWYARGPAIRVDGTPGHRQRSAQLNMDGSPVVHAPR